MMDKLMKQVGQFVEEEYGRAGARFGLTNNSDHESYAVILEELQEAEQELAESKKALQDFWHCTKHNFSDSDKIIQLEHLYNRAFWGACEMIQVAAMAKKAFMTVCDRGAVQEFKGEESKR